MAKTLLLGLGGTGSRIVNYVADDLKKRKISINDDQVCCVVLDTNGNDQRKIMETGVGVPVISTSKNRIIRDYINMYANKGVRSWMPESPALLKESMLDGAAQMRSKSRLAFMDARQDRTIYQLEAQINKLFVEGVDTKIRVMVVSSLAGGTGAGMFIQVALWLRKFFSKKRCAVTIRGIFVLPDVFINTIEDIRNDDTEIQSLYANAYGAIRELNAITKIKTKGMKPLLPVKIEELFNSEKDQSDGQSVYDYAFFVDDISEGGSVLNQIDHYEQVVARLIYMQMYAPMHDDLYSEEDNLFKRFQRSKEPVFGSCGTAKATYPTEDVLHYCALRAAQDSLSSGWRRIDKEIKEKQRKEEEKEKNGAASVRRINPRDEYMRLFDAKAQRTNDQIGKDRLFSNIANDIKNEELIDVEDGKQVVNYTDKVDDFIEKLDTIIASAVDTANPGDLSNIKLKKTWIDKETDTQDTLVALVVKKEKDVKRFIEDMNESIAALAEDTVEPLCPNDVGDLNAENAASVFGMLTKKDSNEETYFVHPIAVRYLLYKLSSRIEAIKGTILLDKARQCAENGYGNGKPKIDFDNKRTRKEEEDAVSYLKSKGFMQSEEKRIKEFKALYAQHNAGQAELCRVYAISYLKSEVLKILSKRLEKLIDVVEDFFANLEKVSNSLNDAVSGNISKNEQTKQKIIYICASGEEKEALYKSLRLDVEGSHININEIIAKAVYGQFCVDDNPNADNNKEYTGKSIENTFYKEVIATYRELILSDNKDDVDLDIYSAICKSADIEYQKRQEAVKKDKADSDRLNIDVETGEELPDEKNQRHVRAMEDMARRLYALGAPFLISDEEQPEDPDENPGEDSSYFVDDMMFMPIKKRKTFWGFHPIVAEKCPQLAQILGVNVSLQQNRAYAKNELDCYRAVYGIQAGYVEKFNELKNGDYYSNYRHVVRRMLAGVGEGHHEELIHTPHLDKTWHLFLPYITPEKQQMEDAKFYRLFWLALAYGMLTLDKSGKYLIERVKKTATGEYTKYEPVLLNGETIGKVYVNRLITALKLDGSFVIDAERLEKKFKGECDGLDAYESTEFLRGKVIKEAKGKAEGEPAKSTVGGLASAQDNNAVTIIVRYHNSPKHDDDMTAMLIQSLEKLCCELVSYKYEANDEEKIKNRGYELCKRMYTASAMKDKDIELIRHWKEAWLVTRTEE